MEEKLDKLISLMETQNKAWEKCLATSCWYSYGVGWKHIEQQICCKKSIRQILLERHPPTSSQYAIRRGQLQQITYNDQYTLWMLTLKKMNSNIGNLHSIFFTATAQAPDEPATTRPFTRSPSTVPVHQRRK